jgi:hypothetical protein
MHACSGRRVDGTTILSRGHVDKALQRKRIEASFGVDTMSHPLLALTKLFFYPVGNTPAVYLAENLSPEDKVQALLLGCGDPRNMYDRSNPLEALKTKLHSSLYTIHMEGKSSGTLRA